MMAWLGTALKSSQPRRKASPRSDMWMVRITGVAGVTAGTSEVALPGVAIVVSLGRLPGRCGTRGDGAAVARIEAIAIGPDAKTGNWPCRELSRDGSANPLKSLLTVR